SLVLIHASANPLAKTATCRATGLRRSLRLRQSPGPADSRRPGLVTSPSALDRHRKESMNALHLPAQATLSESVAPIGAASPCTRHYRQPGHRRCPGAVAAGRRQRRPVGGADLAFRIDPPL